MAGNARQSMKTEAKLAEKNSEDALMLVSDTPFAERLRNNWSKFTQNLHIDEIWSCLIELNVVDLHKKEYIQQNGLRTRKDQVHELLEHICCGPSWRFHAFMRALALTGNLTFIDLLELTTGDYIECSTSPRLGIVHCPLCKMIYTDPYTLVTCGHQLCSHCLSAVKYIEDGAAVSITCPLPTCGKETIVNNEKEDNLQVHINEKLSKICDILRSGITQEAGLIQCQSCHSKFLASEMTHECQSCNMTLCAECFINHTNVFKLHGSSRVHKHSKSVCCRHAEQTLEFCFNCDAYVCITCIHKNCTRHIRKACDKGNLDSFLEACGKLQSDSKGQSLKTLKEHKNELLDQVEIKKLRLMKQVQEWSDEQRNIINTTSHVEYKVNDDPKWSVLGQFFQDNKEMVKKLSDDCLSEIEQELPTSEWLTGSLTEPTIVFEKTDVERKISQISKEGGATSKEVIQDLEGCLKNIFREEENVNSAQSFSPCRSKEIEVLIRQTPIAGHLLCEIPIEQVDEVTWLPDGSLLTGESGSVNQLIFSEDYRHVTQKKMLFKHTFAYVSCLNSGPDGSWAVCNKFGPPYICSSLVGVPKIFNTSCNNKVAFSQDLMILGSLTSIEVYNSKDQKSIFKKDLKVKEITSMTCRSDNTLLFTDDLNHLYMTELKEDSPVNKIIELLGPACLCSDSSLHLYVSEGRTGRIHVFDKDIVPLGTIKLSAWNDMHISSLSILERPKKETILAVQVPSLFRTVVYIFGLSKTQC